MQTPKTLPTTTPDAVGEHYAGGRMEIHSGTGKAGQPVWDVFRYRAHSDAMEFQGSLSHEFHGDTWTAADALRNFGGFPRRS